VRSTPIVLLPRRQLGCGTRCRRSPAEVEVSPRAARVLEALRRDGAMFFDELRTTRACCRWSWKTRWASWCRRGWSTPTAMPACAPCWCRPASAPATTSAGAAAPARPWKKRAAGRWCGAAVTITERETAAQQWQSGSSGRPATGSRACTGAAPVRKPRTDPETLEHIAMTLLRRYGVMFWRLLEREAAWLPSWRELLPVYHRLEARGEIRGGRFVAGLSGEQFALPEAIPLLREMRRRAARRRPGLHLRHRPAQPVRHAAAGRQGPALAGNRMLFRDGLPVAFTIVRGVASPAR
jgi:ATP-dependent Lhr-like helicase